MRFFASKIFKDTYYGVHPDIDRVILFRNNGGWYFKICSYGGWYFKICSWGKIYSVDAIDSNYYEMLPEDSLIEFVNDPLFEIELRRSYGR